jgi:hypothetical protein
MDMRIARDSEALETFLHDDKIKAASKKEIKAADGMVNSADVRQAHQGLRESSEKAALCRQ